MKHLLANGCSEKNNLFFPLCRATVIPPSTSPKEMWELDITGPADKTQYGSPFKTRERRKLERQQKK